MLYFTVEGEGKTLVFLHGFLESSSMWNFLKLHNLKTQNVFIDLLGHGQSELVEDLENPSINFMANEVHKMLDFLKIDSYSVVGHSMGGYVALSLKEIDKKCQKVVLLNSNFWGDNEQKKKDRIRVAEIAFKAKKLFIKEAIPHLFGKPENFPKEINDLKNEALQISPESIAYSSLAMRLRKDFTNEVQTNPSDYYLLHGMQDKLVDVDFLRSQFNKEENLYLIEDAGHMAHIEQSEEVLEILKEIFA